MTEPTLTCPTCRTEIKLTESLAPPLIADTRRRYETQLAQKEDEVAVREAAVREQQEQLARTTAFVRRTTGQPANADIDLSRPPVYRCLRAASGTCRGPPFYGGVDAYGGWT
jgi:hypothetical protein